MITFSTRTKISFLVLLSFLALAFPWVSSRIASNEIHRESRYLMGTEVSISLAGVSKERARRGFELAFGALEEVDREMSGRPGSPLHLLNTSGSGKVSQGLFQVVSDALRFAALSGGAFDPTVAPLLDLWKIETGPHPPPTPPEREKARQQVGFSRVKTDPASLFVDLGGTRLDLGGIAKGYGVDRASEALKALGIENFIVDAGGDLYLSGAKNGAAWKVGLADPREPAKFLKVLSPRAGAIVTSGDYERFYEWEGVRHHHIIDPSTALPATASRSVTVWAKTAQEADALSTALFVLCPEKGLLLLKTLEGPEALIVDSSGLIFESPGFSNAAPEVSAR